MPISTEDYARVSDLATRVSERITQLRNPVTEGVPTQCLLKDLGNKSRDEIEDQLCSVITAIYPAVRDSGNAHTTWSSAVGLKLRRDEINLSATSWNRDGGKNDSVIELWLTWRLKSEEFRRENEKFMDARLSLPPLVAREKSYIEFTFVPGPSRGPMPPDIDDPIPTSEKTLWDFKLPSDRPESEVSETSDVPATILPPSSGPEVEEPHQG